MSKLIRQVNVKREWVAVLLSFFYYFSILAAYYVIRPIRDQLAAEAGSDQLPYSFGITFVATLILTPLFAWSVSRFPRRVLMPCVQLFFVTCQLIFFSLLREQTVLSSHSLAVVFFVWVSVFNLFVVSVFWSFMADIWSDSEARRLFPIIGLGGTFGAIAGPLITSNLVAAIGPAALLLVSAGLLSTSIVCVIFLGNWAQRYGVHAHEPGGEDVVSGGMWDGLMQIFKNPFIRIMSIMMILGDAIGTIAYVLITDYSGSTFLHDTIAQTRFAAHMDLSANAIQCFLQLSVTRPMLIHFGAKGVFVFWGSFITLFCLGLVLSCNLYTIALGSMPWIALLQIATRGLSHGMLQPARESLYTQVSRNLRYKGKNAVDTAVWRAGDVLSLAFVNLFIRLGFGATGFGLIWATLAATSGWLGWRLAKQIERTRPMSSN